MDLAGMWRATTADESLRRTFSEPDLDDGDWAQIPVPHHWRSHPAFATTDGPLLYRRRFDAADVAPVADGRPDARDRDQAGTGLRTWLQLDGLFYQGDVWMDGSYLGDTEGYFFPHCFEVTEALAQRSEHLLAIELTCDRPTDKAAKRNLTGVFQQSDCIDGTWNPGGIWRPVKLFRTGPVRIARLRVLCIEATEERATAEFRATLDAQGARVVEITTTVGCLNGPVVERVAEHTLAAGANEVRWRVPVEHPRLWWPHALGDQPLYDATVTVSLDRAARASDQRAVRTGLRQVRMRNFVATVNGERLFLKGANQGPTVRELGQATPEQLEGDVALALEAGLDLLRVHGHVSRPELYDAADRQGLLLWQDLPLQGGYARVRKQAIRQAAEAVDLLGHHPSIALWCGHNEPLAIDHAAHHERPIQARPSRARPTRPFGRGRPARPVGAVGDGVRQLLPNWNKSVLDRSIHRALEKADGSRPVVAHSGVLPHPAWGTDSHLYYGWYRGDEREFPALLARLPILARFVSEFGAQAVPDGADWCQPDRWPDLDWPHLAQAHCLQKDQFDRYVPPASHATFDTWRAATQAYQAQVIRFQVETLRRLKYRPTGGFCQFCLGDSQAGVTWSVLDHRRRPKQGWYALADACAPVIVVADRPAETYRTGDDVTLAVHVVSDLRVPITDGRVDAVLSWPGGNRTWQFAGEVAADSCARVGLVQMAAPGTSGPLILDLDLTWPDGKAQNQYVSQIVAPLRP